MSCWDVRQYDRTIERNVQWAVHIVTRIVLWPRHDVAKRCPMYVFSFATALWSRRYVGVQFCMVIVEVQVRTAHITLDRTPATSVQV